MEQSTQNNKPRCPFRRGVNRSLKVARGVYPTRADYATFLQRQGVNVPLEIFAGVVNQHWQTLGQTGCTFAQWLAASCTDDEWRRIVIDSEADAIDDRQVLEAIDQFVTTSIESPTCELVSFIFPKFTKTNDLVGLIRALLQTDSFHLDHVEEVENGGLVALGLRFSIMPGVLSWPLILGDFPFFPRTRQAPFVELVARVKPKPADFHENLTPDLGAAHLADVPVPYSHARFARQFTKTKRRVAEHEPWKALRAARFTVLVPASVWSITK